MNTRRTLLLGLFGVALGCTGGQAVTHGSNAPAQGGPAVQLQVTRFSNVCQTAGPRCFVQTGAEGTSCFCFVPPMGWMEGRRS